MDLTTINNRIKKSLSDSLKELEDFKSSTNSNIVINSIDKCIDKVKKAKKDFILSKKKIRTLTKRFEEDGDLTSIISRFPNITYAEAAINKFKRDIKRISDMLDMQDRINKN